MERWAIANYQWYNDLMITQKLATELNYKSLPLFIFLFLFLQSVLHREKEYTRCREIKTTAALHFIQSLSVYVALWKHSAAIIILLWVFHTVNAYMYIRVAITGRFYRGVHVHYALQISPLLCSRSVLY